LSTFQLLYLINPVVISTYPIAHSPIPYYQQVFNANPYFLFFPFLNPIATDYSMSDLTMLCTGNTC